MRMKFLFISMGLFLLFLGFLITKKKIFILPRRFCSSLLGCYMIIVQVIIIRNKISIFDMNILLLTAVINVFLLYDWKLFLYEINPIKNKTIEYELYNKNIYFALNANKNEIENALSNSNKNDEYILNSKKYSIESSVMNKVLIILDKNYNLDKRTLYSLLEMKKNKFLSLNSLYILLGFIYIYSGLN